MSVWSNVAAASPALAGAEGVLVSISVSVEPPRLEELLDALAQLEFPINPQIYHDAALVYRDAEDHEKIQPTTLVEFPAYEARLPEIRTVLASRGFAPESVEATAMLEEIHSEDAPEAHPAGHGGCFRLHHRHAAAAA
jgi:hypothetical protein